MFANICTAVKAGYAKAKQFVSKKQAAAGLGLVTLTEMARAELPAGVATLVAQVETDGKAMFDLVFPVIGTLLGLSILIKIFKRFINKA